MIYRLLADTRCFARDETTANINNRPGHPITVEVESIVSVFDYPRDLHRSLRIVKKRRVRIKSHVDSRDRQRLLKRRENRATKAASGGKTRLELRVYRRISKICEERTK